MIQTKGINIGEKLEGGYKQFFGCDFGQLLRPFILVTVNTNFYTRKNVCLLQSEKRDAIYENPIRVNRLCQNQSVFLYEKFQHWGVDYPKVATKSPNPSIMDPQIVTYLINPIVFLTQVTTQHCVDNPKVKLVPVEVENCHTVTKVDCIFVFI